VVVVTTVGFSPVAEIANVAVTSNTNDINVKEKITALFIVISTSIFVILFKS